MFRGLCQVSGLKWNTSSFGLTTGIDVFTLQLSIAACDQVWVIPAFCEGEQKKQATRLHFMVNLSIAITYGHSCHRLKSFSGLLKSYMEYINDSLLSVSASQTLVGNDDDDDCDDDTAGCISWIPGPGVWRLLSSELKNKPEKVCRFR